VLFARARPPLTASVGGTILRGIERMLVTGLKFPM
jgi:hypothetical protein